MTTEERIKEIRERAERATKGPWTWDESGGEYKDDCAKLVATSGEVCNFGQAIPYEGAPGDEPNPDDKDFIAHAREDVEWLLDCLESCRSLIQRCADDPHGFVIAPQFAREFLEKMPKLGK